MSCLRSDNILSKHCFEYCTYVVREFEADKYREAGIDNLLVIPRGEVKDFMTTLYWIINNTPEDVIFIADDDIYGFYYRMNNTLRIENEDKTPNKELITSEVERIAQLVVDLGVGMATETATSTAFTYDGEFGFKTMPGHIRWINKSKLKAKLTDEPTSSDIDMVMQELLKNRIILCPKYFCSNTCGMDKNAGATIKRKEHEEIQIAMRNKWGRYYKYDFRRNIPRINVKR